MGWMTQGAIPSKGKKFFLLWNIQSVSGHTSLLLHGMKWPGHVADHSYNLFNCNFCYLYTEYLGFDTRIFVIYHRYPKMNLLHSLKFSGINLQRKWFYCAQMEGTLSFFRSQITTLSSQIQIKRVYPNIWSSQVPRTKNKCTLQSATTSTSHILQAPSPMVQLSNV